MPKRKTALVAATSGSLSLAWKWVGVFALVQMLPIHHADAADPIDYARDVRPILADKCFACHGPDDSARKAKLRLDRQADALAPRAGTAAIIPGKPDESELVARIFSHEPEELMPPADSGKALNVKQKELLRRWVEQGAQFTEHWAFTPPRKPVPPVVQSANWVRSPIDAFVMAGLEQERLTPSAEADRITLIRRLSLDLIGLPPTPAEVDAFVADQNPDAYDRLVERLLSSPHYGERWGRIWLDAARYADSDGYEKDKSRQVWFYRDWVIDALNRDLPYNQFLIEQIAGDLLPNATQAQQVATGFLRNSMINEEGGIDPEQFRMEAMFDRMDAIGTGILGLTIKCAQCHSHKYDPISQDEYYRMFAFLNDSHEANIEVFTPEENRKRQAIELATLAIEDSLKARTPDWREQLARWEQAASAYQTDWQVVQPQVDDDSTGGQKYLPLPDGSFLAQGYAPTKHRVKLTVKVAQPRITGYRLELLTDPNLPLGGPGRSIRGTGALTEFSVEAAPANAADKSQKVTFATATADVNPPEAPLDPIFDDRSKRDRVTGPVTYAMDGKDETAWGFDLGPGRRNQAWTAVFQAAQPLENAEGSILTFYIQQNHGGWNSDDNQNNNLGRFRLSITNTQAPQANPVPPAIQKILATPADQRTAAQAAALFSHWRTTVPEWADLNALIELLWRTHPEGSSQLVLSERATPRPTNLLQRGDFLKPVHPVQPGVPAFLNRLPEDSAPGRLRFARWLADRQAPTTARAFTNRVWQAYFGTGLVETTEDLGTQSAAPSHPELLDWLATEFMDRGWSVKELHRLIVSSSTYRQQSPVSPILLARDPNNRLLARGPRYRVDAELVRDIALAASGLLDPTVGGSSSFPPAPAFLFAPPASYGPKIWQEAQGPGRYRRALYTFRYRSVPYPMLQAFDAPNGDIACVRRTRSNTPLQALTTLNEPLFLESARALGILALTRGGASDEERLNFAFKRCLSRPPAADESAALLTLLDRQTKHFSEPGRNPWELAAGDPAKPPTLPANLTPAQAAAWTSVARVLLNLDETISKE